MMRKKSRRARRGGGGRALRKSFNFLIFTALSIAVFLLSVQIRRWVNESNTFSLQKVFIEGNELLNKDEILAQIDLKSGTNVTELNLNQAQTDVENHPYVQVARVSRLFPASMQIKVVERKPLAYISQDGLPLCAIDDQAILLPIVKDIQLGGLPVITGLGGFDETPGEAIESARVMDALNLLKSIQLADSAYYRRISEVHFDPQKGFVAYFDQGRYPVYFGYEQFFNRAINHFIFLKQAGKDKKIDKIKYVDLRFEKQVVVKFN